MSECTCSPLLDNEIELRGKSCPIHGIQKEEESSHRSEVALILAQIKAEYEAGLNGLHGFAQGSTRHSFITARMEKMGQLHETLQGLVGDEAIGLIAMNLDTVEPNNTISS